MAQKFKAGSALFLAGARGGSLLGFVAATAILSRVLPLGDYGTFRQCWTVYLALSPVVAVALSQSLFFFLPRHPGAARLIVLRTVLLSLAAATAIAGAMFATRSWIASAFSNPGAASAFGLFAVFLALSVPTQLSDGIFMPASRVGHAALFNVLNRLVVLVALALPVWLLGWRLDGALISLLVAQAGLVLLLWWRSRSVHDGVVQEGQSIPTLWEQVRFALPIAAAGIFGALFLQLDKLVVGRSMPPEAFAVYANGAFENPVVALLASASAATVATELVRLHHEGEGRGFVVLWRQVVERLALVVLPMGVFLFVFAPEVVVLLFSERYRESAGVFRVYVLLTPVRIVGFSTLFMAINRNKAYLIGHVFACAGVLALALPAAAAGILGPAVAMVVTTYALSAGFLYVAAKTLGATLREMLPLRLGLTVLLPSVAAAWLSRGLAVDLLGMRGSRALIGGAVACSLAAGGALLASKRLRTALLRG